MSTPRVTIYDVAKSAGVSSASVSRAINNDPRISAGTVAKIRAAMRHVGYVPRPAKHRQSSRKTPPPRPTYWHIAVLTTARSWLMQRPVYGNVLHGLDERLHELQYNLVLRHVPEASPAGFLPERVDGAILFNAPDDPKLLKAMRKLACVHVMGLPDDTGLFDHVTYNNRSIGRLAAQHLLDAGRRELACIGMEVQQARDGVNGERLAVFEKTVTQAGAKCTCLDGHGLLVKTETTQWIDPVPLREVVERLAAQDPRPTGIFVVSDELLVPLYPLLREVGMEPGRDVDVVGCNNEQTFLNAVHPCPATVDIHSEKVGLRAAEQVVWRLSNPEEPRVTIMIEPTLVLERNEFHIKSR